VTRVRCRVHGGDVRQEDAVVIAATEAGSGASLPAYACMTCVRDEGIVPPRRHAGRAYTPSPPLTGLRR
jgi:hypothetical protein